MENLSVNSVNDYRPRIAFLMGDCTGIGPELVANVLHGKRLNDVARLVVVGDARVLELGMRNAGVEVSWTKVPNTAAIDWSSSAVPLIDLGNVDPSKFEQGKGSAESGKLTGDTLAYAIEMARRDEVEAITFAPLNKRAMFDGGWRFADEHKMFAHLLGHEGYFSEMNVLDGQWMSRVTGHMALREALDHVTPQNIREAIILADTMMRRAGIENPRIAVNALNPHNGENGLFGREEIEVIRPVVQEMAAKGINCSGPYPPDTIFIKAFAGEFDSVVSMYHDQGQIATKLHGFHRGVTITAGLKTIFTTPAHGTAFDIVGKGIAKTGAIENALRLAARLVSNKPQVASVPIG
jgi:4-hydroxythreonine-4-phosphate dehydrogenase